jgi:porin
MDNLKLTGKSFKIYLIVAVMSCVSGLERAVAQEVTTSTWLKRETLTGEWGGARSKLSGHGITVKPRLSLFYQGITSGEGDNGFEFGTKADLLLNADLAKLGLWKGLSLNIHAEYNFGNYVNLRGGTIMPVNTAMAFPGIDSVDAFDLSTVTLKQVFGNSTTLTLGKISIIDYCNTKPFMGGVGIESFWNIVFAAPPSGTVPAYFFGAILSVRTQKATYGLWVYDPNSSVNKAGLKNAFTDGVTIRGSVSLPVTIAGLSGHQGFAASYSTKDGTDLSTLDGSYFPEPPPTLVTKNNRYYFSYTFDQFLYQSLENPKEGVGLFGQFGISDGNPNVLHWMVFCGVGGSGLIPGRSMDKWGVGYYCAAPSKDLKESLAPERILTNENCLEIFYNFALTPWFVLGADLQVVSPGRADETASFVGFRTLINF